MTDRYKLFLDSMSERDKTLTTLSVLSIGIVLAWVLLDVFPISQELRNKIKYIYLFGGVALYVVSVVMIVINQGGA